MKKLSRILCKLLGYSCALNFMLEVSNVKVIAGEVDKTNVPKQKQMFLNKNKVMTKFENQK